MDCDAVRLELAALIYDELDDDLTQRVEAHLKTCPACRVELDARRRTVRMLDEWALQPRPVGTPTSVIRVQPRARYRWLRPVIAGTAAAAIAFVALSLVGVSVRYGDGQFVVALGRPATTPASGAKVLEDYEPVLRIVAREEVTTRLGELLAALETDLLELERDEQAQRMLLVQAVDQRRDADLVRFAAVIDNLARQHEEEARRARRFVDEITAWRMAVDEALGVDLHEQDAKEES